MSQGQPVTSARHPPALLSHVLECPPAASTALQPRPRLCSHVVAHTMPHVTGQGSIRPYSRSCTHIPFLLFVQQQISYLPPIVPHRPVIVNVIGLTLQNYSALITDQSIPLQRDVVYGHPVAYARRGAPKTSTFQQSPYKQSFPPLQNLN